ncbi:MAG: hypothetical protein KAT79_04030, partial [candidate division Zixibacteria bacterium]|nr:hypothetical protein [candidate division Zixibacteria bacterium]
MADKPLLIFPNPIEAAWPEGPPRGGASNYHFPSVQKQKDRLTPQFEAMLQSVVTDSSTGIEPERVLVIETIGEIDDFARAVRAIDGLEWLAEIDSDAIEPDIDFYDRPKIGKHLLYTNIEGVSKRKSLEIRNILERESFVDKYGTLLDRDLKDFIPYLPEEFEELREEIFATLEVASRPTKLIKRRLFLSMSNRRAMEHLLRLWKQWDSDRTLPFRYQKWSDIFSFLRVIRPWNVDDRLRETGVLEYWAKNLQFYQQEGALIPFEVELWYRDDLTKRQEAVNIITALIQSEGGRVVRTCTIEEIRFCALKAELPADKIERVLASKYIELFRCEDVMFFRPIGQCAVGELPAGEL